VRAKSADLKKSSYHLCTTPNHHKTIRIYPNILNIKQNKASKMMSFSRRAALELRMIAPGALASFTAAAKASLSSTAAAAAGAGAGGGGGGGGKGNGAPPSPDDVLGTSQRHVVGRVMPAVVGEQRERVQGDTYNATPSYPPATSGQAEEGDGDAAAGGQQDYQAAASGAGARDAPPIHEMPSMPDPTHPTAPDTVELGAGDERRLVPPGEPEEKPRRGGASDKTVVAPEAKDKARDPAAQSGG
jgi:hypothetical protein